MKILIAEDDGTSRLLLAHTLKAAGHEVIATADGTRALEAYVTNRPSVVITDWQMPGVDGLEVVQRIRAMKSPRYPWLIMLTAQDFKANYAATMKAGVDDYLTKPLDRELLAARIEVARRVVELHSEVSLLKHFIPICMCCRAVRDTSEHWLELDQYFRQQTGVDFSHGYCPDCFFEKSVLPELERYESQAPAVQLKDVPGLEPTVLASLTRFDREQSPALLCDMATHLQVVGARQVARLEKEGMSDPRSLADVKLLARLAKAMGAGALCALAAPAAGARSAALLRAELQRVKASLP